MARNPHVLAWREQSGAMRASFPLLLCTFMIERIWIKSLKQGIYTITENKMLVPGIYRMRLAGDVSAFTAPGQFLNIRLDGRFLRRPVSLCDLEMNAGSGMAVSAGRDTADGILTIIYKTVGEGTAQMSSLPAGEKLDVLTGLGNGYDISEQGLTEAGDIPLLIGGGVGVPPLYYLARRLMENEAQRPGTDKEGKKDKAPEVEKTVKAAGKTVRVVLGFNTKAEVFYEEEFRALGCEVTVACADGSYGVKGFATDALPETYSYVYTCGPLPMLKAVYRATQTSGQYSFEERMGCGFGACMGCTCKTAAGYKRICKDGPVLRKEEILWEK